MRKKVTVIVIGIPFAVIVNASLIYPNFNLTNFYRTGHAQKDDYDHRTSFPLLSLSLSLVIAIVILALICPH